MEKNICFNIDRMVNIWLKKRSKSKRPSLSNWPKEDVSIYYPIGKHPRLESFDIKVDKLLNRKTFTKDALVTYPKMTEKELAEKMQEYVFTEIHKKTEYKFQDH